MVVLACTHQSGQTPRSIAPVRTPLPVFYHALSRTKHAAMFEQTGSLPPPPRADRPVGLCTARAVFVSFKPDNEKQTTFCHAHRLRCGGRLHLDMKPCTNAPYAGDVGGRVVGGRADVSFRLLHHIVDDTALRGWWGGAGLPAARASSARSVLFWHRSSRTFWTAVLTAVLARSTTEVRHLPAARRTPPDARLFISSIYSYTRTLPHAGRAHRALKAFSPDSFRTARKPPTRHTAPAHYFHLLETPYATYPNPRRPGPHRSIASKYIAMRHAPSTSSKNVFSTPVTCVPALRARNKVCHPSADQIAIGDVAGGIISRKFAHALCAKNSQVTDPRCLHDTFFVNYDDDEPWWRHTTDATSPGP
ncbi:hypothetical protein HYPSUDRAFT_207656 [Hypholoma sublateritium FD-334 SS-4]|uniref:Uncharacterized protein n=1 Tax=Hypholoma sublateritium (strain FD-334 SS-4) TaxID=945553 RepID=A0A0D2KMC8_HYPSF|nr:hypothetical protein HYPSUDRAFT_207656 [Hypholoma sublateritium FD-334 SS-4]